MAAQEQAEGTMSNNSTTTVKEIDSFGNDQTPKVRKPYTITKQREKWTDEEHQRFLEALKLYGRGWRQIEEHVGSKTAVQIRSHAQKFFSKMVREPSNSTESCVKPLEIPPPRPKKKPVHPYPRKYVDSVRVSSTPNQHERSPSPNSTVSERNNGSPTSVFSAVGSEQHNGCSSPTSCTTDVQSINLSSENFLSMNTTAKESGSTTGGETVPLSSIKLFGKTVSVNSSEVSFQAVDHKSATSEKTFVQSKPTKQSDTQLSLGMSNQLAADPWWPVYQGMPYSQTSVNPRFEERLKENEISCTGSNTGSTSEIENREKNAEAVDSRRQQSPDSKAILNKCMKGFVPYKRCLAEREMKSSVEVSEERDRQKVRVCL